MKIFFMKLSYFYYLLLSQDIRRDDVISIQDDDKKKVARGHTPPLTTLWKMVDSFIFYFMVDFL